MRKLQYILFLLILFLCPKVFAATYNVSSKVQAIPNFGGGTYGGYAKGLALPTYYNINTRYNGQLAIIDFYLDSDDWDWNYNKTYTITLNMATEDWRNNFMGPQVFNAQSNGTTTGSNLYVSNTFRFISKKQIKFNFKLSSSMGPYLKFRLYSTNTNTTNITGVNNWNLSSISISTVSATPSPPPVTPTPTPTASSGASNQDIINNNNTNTENIINNNNTNTENIIDNNTQNTTDIINNSNQNSQNIIDNEKELLGNCYTNILDPSNYIIGSDNYIGYYVHLDEGATYTLKGYHGNFGFKIGSNIYGYTDIEQWDTTSDKYTFTYHKNPNNNDNSYTFLFVYNNGSYSPVDLNNSHYVLVKGNYNGDFITYNSEKCFSKLDETTNAINQQNDYLMDNSDPSISDNEFTTLFDSVTVNNPLSSLLQLPVQFINAIVNQSNSCQVVSLGTLLGVPISLPCINLENILGSSIWDTIDVLSSIGLIVLILKQLYESVTNALTLGGYMDAKKGGLGYMSPLEFLCSVITGNGGDF